LKAKKAFAKSVRNLAEGMRQRHVAQKIMKNLSRFPTVSVFYICG
jgi:hypothetical protein